MPTQRLSMRRIKQLLTMRFGAGASTREIARELGVAPSTVREYLSRAAAAGIVWPLAGGRDRRQPNGGAVRQCRCSGWCAVPCRAGLVGAGTRIQAAWRQSAGAVGGIPGGSPGGIRLQPVSANCSTSLSGACRQRCASNTPPDTRPSWITPASWCRSPTRSTGVVSTAEIFVAVLGASSLTYAEATWTQTLPDWIGAHVRLFRFWGASPRVLVPDNLKSAVHKASFYDPGGEPQLRRDGDALWRRHPASPAKAPPRQGRRRGGRAVCAGLYPWPPAQRDVLLPVRLQCCHRGLPVELMNSREMRRLGMSRRQLFEAVERPAMCALPQDDFEYAEWHLPRVGIDYHVEVAGLLLLGATRADPRASRYPRVPAHRRGVPPRQAASPRTPGAMAARATAPKPDHMPSAHRRYAEWTPERLQRDARGIGPATEALIIAVIARRPHPEQGFRTCLGHPTAVPRPGG